MLKCDICGKEEAEDYPIKRDITLTNGHPGGVRGSETLHTFDACLDCIDSIKANGVELRKIK